ncbi:hypothetical protein [Urbifossiella limnaea]|uniref:Uncharacterized protein n=1 Tax=Urbifossiella limnaea TaxID=2528023 RepID=A0A517XYF4_9BACT|nr:hypothetical protein [Urbifossiella limnaea]QDU22544.1 hypothetical protein ETAA1_45260 [Urbifossiella limnaea]
MRKLLRVLAAVQTWTAAAVCGLAGFGTVVFVAAGESGAVYFLVPVALAAALVASVGGILWCLTVLTAPPPAPSAPPGARFGLRVLSLVLMSGAPAAAVGLAVDPIRPQPGGSGAIVLVVTFATLGLAGAGAVLWCLVRLAYPDRPADATPTAALRPARSFVSGSAGLIALGATVGTASATAWLTWDGAGNSWGAIGRRGVAVVAGAVAVVAAGLVWCGPVIALAPVAPPGRPGGRWLRVLAGSQATLGAALAAAAGAHVVTHAGPDPWPPNERVLVGVSVFLLATGMSCVGGVLWCAVRVAYPPQPSPPS